MHKHLEALPCLLWRSKTDLTTQDKLLCIQWPIIIISIQNNHIVPIKPPKSVESVTRDYFILIILNYFVSCTTPVHKEQRGYHTQSWTEKVYKSDQPAFSLAQRLSVQLSMTLLLGRRGEMKWKISWLQAKSERKQQVWVLPRWCCTGE